MDASITLVVTLALLLALPVITSAEEDPSLAQRRAQNISKGINLSHWWAQSQRGYGDEHLQTFMGERDWALIRDLGFDHVRYTIDDRALTPEGDITTLRPERVEMLKGHIASMLEHDLSVIVDNHPGDELKRSLREGDEGVQRFATFWGNLAAALADTDPERVFLEVLNEPAVPDEGPWRMIQRQALDAMRKNAPEHTLVATAHSWASPQHLLEFEPYDHDRNIVYTFHFYEPHTFTHQGAGWGWEGWRDLRKLPYPGTEQAVEGVLDEQASDRAREVAKGYAEQGWDADRVRGIIDELAAWSDEHGDVPLYCGEFGVYRAHADPADRARWLGDVVSALEAHDIGWAMWDYRGGFHVVDDENGQLVPDETTVKALGLSGTGG